MRLLLDEMYPAAIAEQLRRRGHDIVAVTEQAELRSLPDPALFATAQTGQRAVVTENISDFVPLADRADERGEPHYGLVLVDPAKYPRGSDRTIGRLVTDLNRLLREDLRDQPVSIRHWL